MTSLNRDVRFTPKSGLDQYGRDVRFVPKADILTATADALFDHLVGAA